MSNDPVIHDARLRRDILVAVCIALMAVIAGVTGLNVAQPSMALALQASQAEVLWIINIYAITLAALLLPLGALGDRIGRKPILLAGLLLFGLANLASAFAPTTEIMLVSRLLAGVGAATIMPVTLSVITSAFPDAERAKGIGVWTAVAGGGGIIGMFLSAALVDLASWRLLFALPVVLAALAAVMALRAVPNSREPSPHAFDLLGAALSVVGVVGLAYALHEGPVEGWSDPATLVGLAVGLVGIIGFVLWERRHRAPLLAMDLFVQRGLTSGSITLMTWFGVQAGVFIVLFPFFQVVLGWSGLLATAALMPMAVPMMASSGLAPKLSGRIGARLTMVYGTVLGAIGLALMATFVSVEGGYLSVLPGMVAMGLGMGLTMTPSTESITLALPRSRQGVASAINDVTREFGTALGVALLGALFASGYARHVAPGLVGASIEVSGDVGKGVAGVVALASSSDPAVQSLVLAAKAAFVQGWREAMWVGVLVLALLAIYVLIAGPRRAGSRLGHVDDFRSRNVRHRRHGRSAEKGSSSFL